MKNFALIIITILYSVNIHARYLEVYNHAGEGGGKVHVCVLEQRGLEISNLMSVTTEHFYVGAGARIGAGAIIGDKVVVGERAIVGDKVVVGERVVVGGGSYIGARVTVESWAVIGIEVTIGDRATVGKGAYVGDKAVIAEGATVGKATYLGDGSFIGEGASVGDRAAVGDGATIGSGAYIGGRATVGDGAVIEHGTTFVMKEAFVAEDENSEDTKCAICWTNTISRVALPCMHFAYCNSCISKINKCAMCRVDIEDKRYYQDQDIKEKDAKGEVFRPS